MGLGGISVWQLLIVLVIVVLIFGTKKLKNMGGDIGGAVKNFKSAMGVEEKAEADADAEANAEEGEASEKVDSNTTKEETKDA